MEVAFSLDTIPEFVGLSEEGSEADGHSGGDGASAADYLIDGSRGDADGASHGVLGYPHRREVFFKENLARRNRVAHRYSHSVGGCHPYRA